MISINVVQAEIVSQLKANPILSAALGPEIREAEWQGTEFTYPNIRVRMGRNRDTFRGTCIGIHGGVDFVVSSYSENASSQEANVIAGLVMNALLGIQMNTALFITGYIRLGPGGQVPASQTGQRAWRGEVPFVVNIYAK